MKRQTVRYALPPRSAAARVQNQILRAVGWGALAGMSFLALLAMTEPSEVTEQYRKPEYASWWFAAGAALVAVTFPALPGSRWLGAGVRGAGLVLMHAVLFDVAQVRSDSLHWGPAWFVAIVFAAMLLAAFPSKPRDHGT